MLNSFAYTSIVTKNGKTAVEMKRMAGKPSCHFLYYFKIKISKVYKNGYTYIPINEINVGWMLTYINPELRTPIIFQVYLREKTP